MNSKLAIAGSLIACALIAVSGLFISGCDLSEEQIKVVAQNAGLFSAVGWIAMDNPSVDERGVVQTVMELVVENAGQVQEGSTYSEVLYPILEDVIESDKVLPQYRPIAKAGSLSLLGGIDILFASNPSWKEQQDVAIGVVNSFVLGAKNGLALADDDPVMVAAMKTASMRARVYKK